MAAGIIPHGDASGQVGKHVNIMGITPEKELLHPNDAYGYQLFSHSFPLTFFSVEGDPEALALVKLLQRKSSKQLDQREELVLNIIGAITNLSFYHNPGGSGGEEVGEEREDAEEPLATFVLFQGGREALACLVPYLFSENHEVVSETVRALGNFSRDPSVRQAMKESRGENALCRPYIPQCCQP